MPLLRGAFVSMRASDLISLLVAVLIVTAMLSVSGVTAENQSAVPPGASMDNSITPLPDNTTTPSPIPDQSTAPADNATLKPLTLALGNHTYYPNDTVRVFIFNATTPLVNITDPSGFIYDLTLTPINDTAFMGEYVLNRSVILATYTVRASDNATGTYIEDTFEVTMHQVTVTPIPNPTVTPANETNQTAALRPLYLYLNLSKKDYLPAEQVSITVMTNAGTPTVVVQDPANNTVLPAIRNINNDTYTGVYSLEKAVILGNYTVLAYVNENGTYNYTISYFNVTMGESPASGNEMHVEYAAYDPAQKAIVLRANVNASSPDAIDGIVKNSSAVKGLAIKGVKVLADDGDNSRPNKFQKKADKKIEVLIPVDNNNVDSVTQQLNLTKDITKATISTTVSANGKEIHISLNEKLDDCWYRMSASVPKGYSVDKIVREDGVEIKNEIEIDRSTGEIIKNDIKWYVDNGTLYFYDDPINEYNVSLLPPAASMYTMLVSTGPAVKTLYLHEAPTPFMNTSMNDTASDRVVLKNKDVQTWSQTPEFALDFNILDDPSVTVYVQSEDDIVKMNVTLISTNGVSSSTLGSVVYQASATPGVTTSYTFNVPLSGNNVTVPDGYQLLLRIDNLNNRWLTVYESAQYSSHIDMNTLSYIDVISVNIYDQYGNQVTSTTPPSTVKVLANVTDPFGSYDISDVNLTLYYDNGTAALGPLSMNLSTTDGSSPSMWKLFERNVSLGNDLDSGNYSITVTANESNGVKDDMSAPLAIEYPVNVSVSKSYSPVVGNSFLIAINLKNNDNHTAFGVHAYDFYASDFSVAGFNQPCTSVGVNNAILQGNLNIFGPFTLSPFQTVNITYTAQGIGDYKLSNMTIVGVDPYV